MNAGFGHGIHLVFGGALTAGDDGAGVAHAAAWRRGLAGDESYYGLFDILLYELSGGFFG